MFFTTSPLSRGTIVLISLLWFFLVPRVSVHAEEMASSCKGLRGKELVLCWKKMDPQRARGEHDAFHRGQSAVHLKWHQEHRNMTDAPVTVDHQKLHKDMVQKHQEFHRSAKVQGDAGKIEKKLAPTKSRDAQAAPNKGRSMRRQLRQGT